MRISKKSNMPKWFNLDNYNKFMALDDDMFITQIIVRNNDYLTEVFKQDGYFEDKLSSGLYPLTYPKCNLRKDFNDFRIAASRIFQPLSLLSLDLINENINSAASEVKENSYNHIDVVSNTPFFDGDIHCSIRLDAQDDLIINDLKRLLPQWREQLGITLDEDRIKNSWSIVRSKIISYQAIALYDLLLWQKATGNQITNGVLAVSLYPEGDFDSTNIVQTIKPFVENLFSDSSIEKFDAEISNKKNLR